jgi:hypothetical protein
MLYPDAALFLDSGSPQATSIELKMTRPADRRLIASGLSPLGLGVPVEELLPRAMGVVPSGSSNDEFELLVRFRRLSPERRADVLKIVDLWYSQETH